MLIAVALHDVAPDTFARCVAIRGWLAERGVDRATLLVIPAAGGEPFLERSPELAAWLRERAAGGDAVAQHGYLHRRVRPARPGRRRIAAWQGGQAAEFPGLDAASTREHVRAGRRLMARAGLEPRGFVAPGYAYTPALRRELRRSFDWWATLVRCTPGGVMPALGLGASTRLKRRLSPGLLRAAAPLAGRTLRLDIHPADFDHAAHVRALESVLAARRRRAVNYDELVGG